MSAPNGLCERSESAPTSSAQREHVSARRSRHRRAAGFTGDLSPTESAPFAGGSTKHGDRRAQPGVEPGSYRALHYDGHSFFGKEPSVALLNFMGQKNVMLVFSKR